MAIAHRIGRLERSVGTLADGRRRCRVCKDGTEATGVRIIIEGVKEEPAPRPCPGCGRDEPMVIHYRLAVPPGWTPPPQTPEVCP